MKLIHALRLLPVLLLAASCSREKAAMRKAANAVDECDYDKAVTYYESILKKDSNSYFGNAGKGIVLSEYLGRHEQAIPYLEKALAKSPDKTVVKLNSDLGKSYHYIGNYARALYFYSKAGVNDPDHPDYDVYLSKRIADCRYAIAHGETAAPDEQSVTNAGSVINTPMPEYGAVLINEHLIFTSQRKDDKNEKKNGITGKYFEASYISTLNNGVFSEPKHYTSSNMHRRFSRKKNESVISASADGKMLFVFREGMIYETDAHDTTKAAVKMSPAINFSHFQNHAFLTPDGKTLFFTSETGKEGSGTDIYQATKDENGKWNKPEPLEFNTAYNEDAPFLSENGILYFSSNGLPGYGGFDVYKTHLENGHWTNPENLGQPINSPGDEIYFTLQPNSSYGYYSSSRAGGYGDMDIYKVHYISPEAAPCGTLPLASMVTLQDSANPYAFNMSVDLPEKQKNRVKYYSWKINGQTVPETSDKLSYTFHSADTYTISAQAIVYCDTCPSLITMCAEKPVTAGNTVLVTNETPEQINALASGSHPESRAQKNSAAKSKKGTSAEPNGSDPKQTAALNDQQLGALGWNPAPAYFQTNKYDLNSDAVLLLDHNIGILKNNANLAVIIDGYADSRGPAAYNKILSGQRANSIKSYFVKNGISEKRITTVAHGETGLVNACSDNVDCEETQHQQNRRVQFRVISRPVKTPNTITLR
ncbi:MAG: OmpA family protein [Bacteroidia bacterium]